MKLVVVSHKETWRDPSSPSGFSTVGGFPFQMKAISENFDETRVIVPIRNTPLPFGAKPLVGNCLSVVPLSEPKGKDLERKIQMLMWIPRHLPTLWREARRADAIHTPVGGDIGVIGIFIALAQRKRLFVRHCGTWGVSASIVDRYLQFFLERIAGGRNVVMATGGAATPPSQKNPNIKWIFSTSLSRQELDSLPTAQVWQTESPLRLVTVGRLVAGKNIASLIEALPLIQKEFPNVFLDIAGDGEALSDLQKLAERKKIADRVIFHGNVSHADVLRILSNAHIFAFPTFNEGFPKALLEAMACGLPSVATSTSIIPALIQGCGITMSRPTPEAIADGVLAILRDPTQMAAMSQLARIRAKEYTLEKWRDTIGAELQSAWGNLKK
ncbi:MAG: glycosyltransferase family 4 protein [Anaerolineales bacterium]|nr:glycosyltransferase family 4 protein [Anaerolineales bacterium]